MGLEVVVLAAGAGTRMRSREPKVLHALAGRPLLAHVLDAAATLAPDRVHVVVGEQSQKVKAYFHDDNCISWVLQEPRLGSGHAAAQALPAVTSDATVLVLLGDVPLVRAETLAGCVAAAKTASPWSPSTCPIQAAWDASCARTGTSSAS